MPQFLAALNEQIDTTRNIVVFSLIMARIMAIITLVPFLGARNAPPEIKMGVGVTLSMILWPTVLAGATGDVPITAMFFVLMMLKEVFVGLAIGFIAAEIFYTVEISGQLVDLLRGANQIQIQVPEIQERSSAFGTLNFQLLLVLFLAFDLHHLFFESLFESFIAVPINAWPGYRAGYWAFVDFMLRSSADVIIIAFALSAPVAIVCLIAETSFGLINRVAPQINAYFMAMPAKVIAGCIIFFVSIDMLIEQMLIHTRDFLSRIDHVIELMQY
jgi:flagellar biosynthetic protein FliR